MERNVVKALLDKSFWGPEWSDVKLIERIGCSSAVFYKVKGQSWVKQLRFEKTLEYIEDDLPAVSKTLLESAQISGREGAQDRRTLLTNLRMLVGLLEEVERGARTAQQAAEETDEQQAMQMGIEWIAQAKEELGTDSIEELLRHMWEMKARAAAQAGWGQEEPPGKQEYP